MKQIKLSANPAQHIAQILGGLPLLNHVLGAKQITSVEDGLTIELKKRNKGKTNYVEICQLNQDSFSIKLYNIKKPNDTTDPFGLDTFEKVGEQCNVTGKHLADAINNNLNVELSPKLNKKNDEIVAEICSQLRGKEALIAALDAHKFYPIKNGLMVEFKTSTRVNALKITLNGMIYSLQFLQLSSAGTKTIQDYPSVYSDQLLRLVEKHTGKYFSH